MKLSIIIPVYNEENTIKAVLKKVMAVKIPWKKEIIVVDDGSTDETRDRIKNQELRIKNQQQKKNFSSQWKKSKITIKVIRHKNNLGKGAAIKTGIREATGDYILIQDADLEYNPEEIPKLLTPLLLQTTTDYSQLNTGHRQPTTDNRPLTTNTAIYGSRFLKEGSQIPLLYLIGNKFLTILTNLLYGTNLTDMETAYKLIPASFFKKIKLSCHRFDIEPEITAKLVKSGIDIIEVPIPYQGRSRLAGKKLTVRDGLGAVWTLIYERLYD